MSLFFEANTLIVGLTGGIATGKSTVAKVFIDHHIPVVDADQLARKVVEPHSIGLVQIIDTFGLHYLKSNGTLDRKLLGDLIFNDRFALHQLNAITHPLIEQEANFQFQQLNHHPIIVYDAPLLFETKQSDKYRPLLVAHCTPEQQVSRLMKRGTGHGSLTREEAVVRIEVQTPLAQKVASADYSIDTSGTLDNTYRQTQQIIQCIQNGLNSLQ